MEVTTKKWDASEYLDSPEIIIEYLKAALEEEDTEVLMVAIGNIAKATVPQVKLRMIKSLVCDVAPVIEAWNFVDETHPGVFFVEFVFCIQVFFHHGCLLYAIPCVEVTLKDCDLTI